MKTTWLPLCDPDISEIELEAVREALRVAAPFGGTRCRGVRGGIRAISRPQACHRGCERRRSGLLLTLQAYGIGQGDEVIASSHSFRETAHAIALDRRAPRFRRHRLLGGNDRAGQGGRLPHRAHARDHRRQRQRPSGALGRFPRAREGRRRRPDRGFNRGDRLCLQGIARRLVRRLRDLRLLAARRARLRRGRHDRDRRRRPRQRDPPAALAPRRRARSVVIGAVAPLRRQT